MCDMQFENLEALRQFFSRPLIITGRHGPAARFSATGPANV